MIWCWRTCISITPRHSLWKEIGSWRSTWRRRISWSIPGNQGRGMSGEPHRPHPNDTQSGNRKRSCRLWPVHSDLCNGGWIQTDSGQGGLRHQLVEWAGKSRIVPAISLDGGSSQSHPAGKSAVHCLGRYSDFLQMSSKKRVRPIGLTLLLCFRKKPLARRVVQKDLCR